LLAASILLALGSAPVTALLLPVALGFMLYLAPGRKWLPPVVLVITTAIAVAALWALGGFHGAALAQQLSLSVAVVSARVALDWTQRYLGSVLWLTHYPALLIFLLLALSAYLGSRRVRYFGNTVPLLVLALAWLLAVAGLAPDTHAYGAIPSRVLPFVFVFFGGVAADLLELRRRVVLAPLIAALLLSHTTIGLLELSRSGGSPHPFRVHDQSR
jgi:hypothetical protein